MYTCLKKAARDFINTVCGKEGYFEVRGAEKGGDIRPGATLFPLNGSA